MMASEQLKQKSVMLIPHKSKDSLFTMEGHKKLLFVALSKLQNRIFPLRPRMSVVGRLETDQFDCLQRPLWP